MTTDISLEADEALGSLRVDLIAKIEAGTTGLKVTADPGQINPPCCLVGVPSIEQLARLAGTRWAVEVIIPVTLFAPPPASPSSISWLLRYLLPVMRIVGATEAAPSFFDNLGNPTIPSYPLSVRKRLSILEDGS